MSLCPLIILISMTCQDRVPNEKAKAWATRLLASKVTKIEVQGYGLSKNQQKRNFKRISISKASEIKKVLLAFQGSNRRSSDPEPGANIEIADRFKFFETAPNKQLKLCTVYVVAPEIEYDWGLTVMKMYEFLRKKAK